MTSKSGGEGAARKVKGTLHWVSASGAVPFEARLYEPLLNDEDAVEEETEGEEAALPDKKDFIARLNPTSLTVVRGYAEPSLAEAEDGARFQFLRVGYFAKDADSAPGKPVYNRTVSLKDSWSKAAAQASPR